MKFSTPISQKEHEFKEWKGDTNPPKGFPFTAEQKEVAMTLYHYAKGPYGSIVTLGLNLPEAITDKVTFLQAITDAWETLGRPVETPSQLPPAADKPEPVESSKG